MTRSSTSDSFPQRGQMGKRVAPTRWLLLIGAVTFAAAVCTGDTGPARRARTGRTGLRARRDLQGRRDPRVRLDLKARKDLRGQPDPRT